eukprot:3892-Chlamydomonas_euryale.AAC.1
MDAPLSPAQTWHVAASSAYSRNKWTMVVRFVRGTNFGLRDGQGGGGVRRRLAPHYLRQPGR